MAVLNWELAKNPLNWVIILLMLALAGVGGSILLAYLGVGPATASDSQPSTVSTSKPS